MSAHFEPEMYGWDPRPSATAISRLLFELLQPRSVIDVGCGIGAFVAAFVNHGVEDVLGIDGEATRDVFLLDDHHFQAIDLTAEVSVGRTFDLAICFEVAEHLEHQYAEHIVGTLVGLAPVVAFSAAHPLQGGQGHVNERWPTYWHRLFLEKGYVALDILRGPLCDEPGVADFYRTNAFVYAESRLARSLYDGEVSDALIRAHVGALSQDLLRQPWTSLLRAMGTKIQQRIGA